MVQSRFRYLSDSKAFAISTESKFWKFLNNLAMLKQARKHPDELKEIKYLSFYL